MPVNNAIISATTIKLIQQTLVFKKNNIQTSNDKVLQNRISGVFNCKENTNNLITR